MAIHLTLISSAKGSLCQILVENLILNRWFWRSIWKKFTGCRRTTCNQKAHLRKDKNQALLICSRNISYFIIFPISIWVWAEETMEGKKETSSAENINQVIIWLNVSWYLVNIVFKAKLFCLDILKIEAKWFLCR